MGADQLSAQDRANLIWFCRRLATALQGGRSLYDALADMVGEATPSQGEIIAGAQQHLRKGEPLSEAWRRREFPAYVWGCVRMGEAGARVPESLSRLADWLEVEQSAPQGAVVLRAYALALGRVGMLLPIGVSLLSALEMAAESAAGAEVKEVLLAARAVTSEGVGLAEALARLVPDLPALTTEMIHEGEEEGRLGQVLSVVSDYLFDEGEEAASQEVSRG